ncbi:MAG: adenosine deaminase [Chlorobium sp.]|nr:MAG: adenosine deaminase [Chlorobium sp.]
MQKKSSFLLLIWMLFLYPVTVHAKEKAVSPYNATKSWYNKLISTAKPDIAKLRFFFTLMPKGGDIHQHFTGSLYAENYLDWINKEGYWISKKDFTVITPKDADKLQDTVSVKNLRSNKAMYSDFFTHWSDKDYANHNHDALAPDVQFFNTFSYFSKIFNGNQKYYAEGIQLLKNRAKNENVQYLETMFVSPGYQKADPQFDSLVRKGEINIDNKAFRDTFDGFISSVSKDTLFYSKVNQYRDLVDLCTKGVDDENFTLRFQSYVSRNTTPSQFFSGLYAAFYEADNNARVVGVNIVSPENDAIALADYKLHMQMFRYLKEKYPQIKTSMHAGELTTGMVLPEELKYHISDAVSVAGANRIGHGVDIVYETNALRTLSSMKAHHIPVEINLTSNDFILGVKDEAHPVRLYTDFGVPIVISSDDPGVSRGSLTEEYVLLASRYRYSYDEIKQFVSNSINYSFMTQNEKEQSLKLLQKKFDEFEHKILSIMDKR